MSRTILIVPAILFILSCSKQEEKPVDLVTFPLRGEVISIDTTGLRVTIAHEEIPDYMAEMTMPFKLKDPELLKGLAPGDSILATLAVSRSESWLASIQVTGQGAPPEVLTAGDVQMKRLFQVGDRFPDVQMLDQDARPATFSDYQGKVLAVTFVYTRCPIPEFCIRMSDHFARIQRFMKEGTMSDEDWHLLTVSFDPVYDSPSVLRSYGKSYGADFERWHFLTDPDTSGAGILRIADGLDLTYEADEGSLIAHNLRTVLLDREGRIVEIIKSNEWTPEEVVEKMEEVILD